MEHIETLLTAKPFFLLWFGLNILMLFVKRADIMPSKRIPLLCLVLGTAIGPFITDPGSMPSNVPSPLVVQLLIGLGASGAAVLTHQLFKKKIEDKGLAFGDTEIKTKEATNESNNPAPNVPPPGA